MKNFGYRNELGKMNNIPYDGKFKRFVKDLGDGFLVSFDVLIDEVVDRQTNSIFSADWIFDNSNIRNLRGKTIIEELKLRIINLDALIVLKLCSCRLTDIRDIFMLIVNLKSKDWIKQEVAKRCNFSDRFERLSEKIISKQFKDGLQGVYGFVDKSLFEKHQKLIFSLEH